METSPHGPSACTGGPAEACPGGGWVFPRARRRLGSPFLPPQVLEGAALSARRERGEAGRRCCPSRVPSAPWGAGGCHIGPSGGEGGAGGAPSPAGPRHRPPPPPARWKLARNRRGGSAGGGARPIAARPSRQVWGHRP